MFGISTDSTVWFIKFSYTPIKKYFYRLLNTFFPKLLCKFSSFGLTPSTNLTVASDKKIVEQVQGAICWTTLCGSLPHFLNFQRCRMWQGIMVHIRWKNILSTVYRMNTQEYMEIQMYQNDPKRHIKHTLQKHTIHTSHVLFQKLVENLTWVRLGLQSGVGWVVGNFLPCHPITVNHLLQASDLTGNFGSWNARGREMGRSHWFLRLQSPVIHENIQLSLSQQKWHEQVTRNLNKNIPLGKDSDLVPPGRPWQYPNKKVVSSELLLDTSRHLKSKVTDFCWKKMTWLTIWMLCCWRDFHMHDWES